MEEISLLSDTGLEDDMSGLSHDAISLHSSCVNLMDLEPDLSIYDDIRVVRMKQNRQIRPRRVSYRNDKKDKNNIPSPKRGFEAQGNNDSSRTVMVSEDKKKHNRFMLSSSEYPKNSYLDGVDVLRAEDMALHIHPMPSNSDKDNVETVLDVVHRTSSVQEANLIDDTNKMHSSSTPNSIETNKISQTKIDGKALPSKAFSLFKRKNLSEFDNELPIAKDLESRKLRKLIRNRISAKRHRERQRNIMDSLGKKVKDRDEKITALEKEIGMVSDDQITIIGV